MKSCLTVALTCAVFGVACGRSPSPAPAASTPSSAPVAATDDLRPVGTTGTLAPPAGYDLVNLRNGPAYVNCGGDRRPVVQPVQLNGNTVDHVECVGANGVAYAPVATRGVTERRVAPVEPRRRAGRSWKQSAP